MEMAILWKGGKVCGIGTKRKKRKKKKKKEGHISGVPMMFGKPNVFYFM